MAAVATVGVAMLPAGCVKEEAPEETQGAGSGSGSGGQGGATPTPAGNEGIYLGVIGFNSELYVKEIGLLNESTLSAYNGFIDGLSSGNGTGLYYADYTALKKLKSASKPPKLTNVAVVTFTDGLDNVSTSNSTYDPENYGSTGAYREALHTAIVNDRVHGLPVSAYTIGLKGNDVNDDAVFMETLRKLASSDDNVFQVANIDEAASRFADIAASLYSVSVSATLGLNVPGGYDDGQLLRFTFDNASSATSSSEYIEATYRRPSSSSRTLEGIRSVGFSQVPASVSSSSSSGAYYQFVFTNLTYTDGAVVSQSDLSRITLWKQTSNGGWDRETEFDPSNSTTMTEEKSSALIMLVLDCTTSLGSDFSRMQQGAKSFVGALLNHNDGGTPAPTPHHCHTTYGDTTASAIGSFNWYGSWYTSSGEYTHIITNASGCDSVLTLHLTIRAVPAGFVDLGLPSGLLWAECNLGATTSEGYGAYYAWGETSPKSTYDWSNYRYANGNGLTKYCTSWTYSYNNRFRDTLTRLQAIDDAATQALGNGARTPTWAEWKELMNNTTATWTTLNGVYGRRFTASNGNFIFLPAAGYRYGISLNNAGTDGLYWGNRINTDMPGRAWHFDFSSGSQTISDYGRDRGLSVRPVLSAR